MIDQQALLDGLRSSGARKEKAFGELYDELSGKFERYFVRHRIPHAIAEELVQDVFIQIMRGLEGFRGETELIIWCWTIARNAMRQSFRKAELESEPEVEPDDVDDEALAPQQLHVEQEFDDCVRLGFVKFANKDPDRAQVVEHLVRYKWSMRDLAALIGRSEGATREYVSQCRKKVRPFIKHCFSA